MKREEMMNRYGIGKGIVRVYRDLHTLGKRYYGYLVLFILTGAALPLAAAILPGTVVALLEEKQPLSSALLLIVAMVSGLYILNAVYVYVRQRMKDGAMVLKVVLYMRKFYSRLSLCDLRYFEDQQYDEMIAEIRQTLYQSGENGIEAVMENSMMFFSNLIGIIFYFIILSSFQIIIAIAVVITSILVCAVKSKAVAYEYRHMEKFWENNTKFWYMKKECINLDKAKDIRMYQLQDWFQDAYDKGTAEATQIYRDVHYHQFYANAGIRLLNLARDLCIYGTLIYQMIQGNLSISVFLIYIGIITAFSSSMQEMVQHYTIWKQENYPLSVFFCFVEEEEEDEGDLEVPDIIEEITFEHVTFGYDPEKPILKDFNLCIHKQEKIALVGMNGAGKTTLMKLLCRLYPLQEGRILINGLDISRMNREEYQRKISIVFQDVNIFAFSIAENVSCTWSAKEFDTTGYEKVLKEPIFSSFLHHKNDGYEEERIISCLKQAGLYEKAMSLPKGLETNLTQNLDAEGITLSGGEQQRLMLARALYKDSPILILDEPTAALDPIAESELYQQYTNLCTGKLSVFISHRLSSTRFCDRIIYMEEGRILEEGSHENLIKADGAYAHMYHVQSHYYQEEVEEHEELS